MGLRGAGEKSLDLAGTEKRSLGAREGGTGYEEAEVLI